MYTLNGVYTPQCAIIFTQQIKILPTLSFPRREMKQEFNEKIKK